MNFRQFHQNFVRALEHDPCLGKYYVSNQVYSLHLDKYLPYCVGADMEEHMITSTQEYFVYHKNNREQVLDKIYRNIYSRHRHQKEGMTDSKNRLKKSLQKKQRSRRLNGFFLKTNGLPFDESVEMNIFEMIAE